jgi:hypothetical protein
MFSLKLAINNIFKDREYFENRYWLDTHLFFHKHFELEYFISNDKIFEFELDLMWKGKDHAGPSLTIGIGGYTISFKIYDYRHWNYELNDWEIIDQFH